MKSHVPRKTLLAIGTVALLGLGACGGDNNDSNNDDPNNANNGGNNGVTEMFSVAPSGDQALDADATLDVTVSGLNDDQAYRITLVVADNVTVSGGSGTFVDNDMNGAADAGASENVALITMVNGAMAGAKTVPAGDDDPADPSGIFPSGGEITLTLTGVGDGTVYPVIYHNGGNSTFLEIDDAGMPREAYYVAGGVTVTGGGGGDALYDQLGGEDGIRAVITAFIGNVAVDDRINWMFANADLVNLQNMLHDQICAATGGGCEYTGADMATAHEGMGITNAQFDALIEDFLMTLDDLGVPYSADPSTNGEAIDPLLVALLGMRDDIVEDPDGDTTYFNQLGGYAGVSAVIDGMLANVAANDAINGFFADTDLAMLRQLLIEQVCEATGGFCVYSGRSMAESHAGLGITDADFDALVGDLLAALDDLGVPYSPDPTNPPNGMDALADPLLRALLGMRGDIVEG